MICPQCGTDNSTGRKFCGECGAGLSSRLPGVRLGDRAGHEVLRRVRDGASGDGAGPARRRAPGRGGRRAAAGVGALRRPGGVHHALGGARLRRGARAPVALLRHLAAADRALRRDGREVHRRRRDGGVGHAGGDRGRRRAGRAGRARPGRGRHRRWATRSASPTCAPGRACSPARPPSRSAPTARAWWPATSSTPPPASSRWPSPGQVLAGETTRRTTEPTIVYEGAGTHELKGKSGLHTLWRAVRVVSGARGALKSEGLEAPFVGRDRELRQIKDLFHASAEERRAHLISVTGIAGIGKSRLAWEFYKYFDGLAQIVYWHRGRCLSYGEGVTYWALADMVRMRCRISEDEGTASALAKLAEVLDEHVTDADERRFVEPRVAHLIGLEEGSAFAREDLFAAWRTFFERLADVYPTVLAFEDMQWADASLLDFIEYLLEWSRQSPLLVVTAARPGAGGEAADLGGGQAQLHLGLPRAALAAGDARPAGGARSRPARHAARPDPGPGGGRAPVRDGDGAHAARPRPPRARGQRLPADRAGGGAGGARDAARADRRPPGRPERRRAAHGAGRSGAGQDLHPPGARRRSRARPTRRSSRSSRRSCARRCSRSRPTRARPSTASTGSCRT